MVSATNFRSWPIAAIADGQSCLSPNKTLDPIHHQIFLVQCYSSSLLMFPYAMPYTRRARTRNSWMHATRRMSFSVRSSRHGCLYGISLPPRPCPAGIGGAWIPLCPTASSQRAATPSSRSLSAGISPRLVSGGDWGGTGPCPSAHGDSTEVRGLKGGGDLEKCNQSAAEREIPARVEQSVLGWRRGLGTRVCRLHGGRQRSDHSALYPATRRAGDGSSAA